MRKPASVFVDYIGCSMKHIFIAVLAGVFLLGACVSPEQARKKSYIGTSSGKDLYEFTLQYWSTALWARSKFEGNVKRSALKRCPQGYREISRTSGNPHTYYGGPVPMPYTDINVRIACRQ